MKITDKSSKYIESILGKDFTPEIKNIVSNITHSGPEEFESKLGKTVSVSNKIL